MSETPVDDLQLDIALEFLREKRGSESPRAWHEAWSRARASVGDAWADLNGLKRSRSHFSYQTLAAGGVFSRELFENPHPYFDHREYFRWPGCPPRPAAIVVHLYDRHIMARAAAFAERAGLQAHFPPVPHASWYLPGRTILVCYTRPGVLIKWLPVQSDPKWERRA